MLNLLGNFFYLGYTISIYVFAYNAIRGNYGTKETNGAIYSYSFL